MIKLIAIGSTLVSLPLLVISGLSSLPAPTTPTATAVGDVPPNMLALYQRAALTCPGLDWSILAAVGKVETDHGRSSAIGVKSGANAAGARGPMQFLPGTFAAYSHPVEADPVATEPHGGGPVSPYDSVDAVYAAARYLCTAGVADNVHDALVTYNCGNRGPQCQLASAGYAASVLRIASGYARLDDQVSAAGQLAVQAAMGMLGTPYVWGGESPSGFDCSGLAQWAYAHAGIALPRTAQEQYDAGPRRSVVMVPQVGDLVFFGADARHVSHVGIYVGGGVMVDAPHTGATVRLDRIDTFLPHQVGLTAPGSSP